MIPQRSEPEHSVTSLNTTMFHILILVQMNNTKTCENKGHVLTDTAMAQTFFSLYLQLMQQMCWLTMEECLIILKALSASYTLPTHTFECKT